MVCCGRLQYHVHSICINAGIMLHRCRYRKCNESEVGNIDVRPDTLGVIRHLTYVSILDVWYPIWCSHACCKFLLFHIMWYHAPVHHVETQFLIIEIPFKQVSVPFSRCCIFLRSVQYVSTQASLTSGGYHPAYYTPCYPAFHSTALYSVLYS